MQKFDESSIGRNIKKIRTERGLTQQQISVDSGIQNTVISSYENGRKKPGLITLISLAQALNVSLDELVFGTTAEKIINSSKEKSEIIVRCIYELWKLGIIYPPYSLYQARNSYSELQAIDLRGVWKFDYPFAVDRLLEQLNDHKENAETYSNPESHINQILESAMNEIKKSIK